MSTGLRSVLRWLGSLGKIDQAKARKLSMLLEDIVKDAKEHGILPAPLPTVVVGRKKAIDNTL